MQLNGLKHWIGEMKKLRIGYDRLVSILTDILVSVKMDPEKARLCATLFVNASRDGVASHGLNRFPSFIDQINGGIVDVKAEPECVDSLVFFERWDGNLGAGNINAWHAMNRAIELAKINGIGCVSLRNTNHWMRGGNYGWQAVENNCIGICFTNTKPNMPAWGGSEPVLGNNPLVIGIPQKNSPIVLDMALAQYSYGKLSEYVMDDKSLPYDGGFNEDGNLTKDPEVIQKNELALPIGLWKGAGLSLVTDLIVSILSDGKSTMEIGTQEEEYALSQLFLCFYPQKLGAVEDPEILTEKVIKNLKSSSVFEGEEVRYPGERTLQIRKENIEKGIPVNREIWKKIISIKN